MSVFDKIWKSDDEPKKKPEEEIDLDAPVADEPVSRLRKQSRTLANTAPSAPIRTPAASSLTLPMGNPAGQADADMVKVLEDKVANATKPEYTQFRAFFETLNTLAEDARYTMALQIASVSKITGPAILSAMDARIAAVDEGKGEFEQYIAEKTVTDVTNKEAAVAEIDAHIVDLQRQLAEASQSRAERFAEATQNKAGIDQERSNFEASYNMVRTNLVAERDRTAAHIPPK